MNRQLLFTMSAGLLAAGCVTSVPPGAPVCEAYPDPASLNDCKGDPNAPHVTLNMNMMIAEPHCVYAYPGKTLVFQIKPAANNKLRRVDIFPKQSAGNWLAGSNSENEDYILIKVPAKLKKGDHDYGIKTASKCVDPRVRVQSPGGSG